MRMLVTGASGFVGRSLLARMPGAIRIPLGANDWRERVEQADYRDGAVVHLAARVHESGASWAQWEADNVVKSEALARAAARSGAARFVFMSTIKVHGEETHDAPFHARDALQPHDAYARSKALAEERLRAVSKETGLPVAVIRAPLVFGSGAKANLRRVLRLAASGIPLPFARIENRRSWVHVDDLSDLIVRVAHDAAGPVSMIAAHPRPFSTPELISGLRSRMHRVARLFPLARKTLEVIAAVAGQAGPMRRLTRSLEGDPAEALARGWQPRHDFSAAMDELIA